MAGPAASPLRCTKIRSLFTREATMSLRVRILLGFALMCGIGTATGIALAGGHGRPRTHAKVCGSAPDDGNGMVSFRAEVDSACDCASATHHGAYVSCVARMAKLAVKSGALAKECRGGVVHCARRSTCGRTGTVSCCRTHKNGVTKCSAMKPEDCRAPSAATDSWMPASSAILREARRVRPARRAARCSSVSRAASVRAGP
jgi:hypothetical protein